MRRRLRRRKPLNVSMHALYYVCVCVCVCDVSASTRQRRRGSDDSLFEEPPPDCFLFAFGSDGRPSFDPVDETVGARSRLRDGCRARVRGGENPICVATCCEDVGAASMSSSVVNALIGSLSSRVSMGVALSLYSSTSSTSCRTGRGRRMMDDAEWDVAVEAVEGTVTSVNKQRECECERN